MEQRGGGRGERYEKKGRGRAQVIKTFSTREGWWYIGIKVDGGIESKGTFTRLLIEKEN